MLFARRKEGYFSKLALLTGAIIVLLLSSCKQENPEPGDCQAQERGDSPLYSHYIYMTTSDDGIHFDPQSALILEHASVADLTIGKDGSVWAYFVNGQPGKHGIFAARQTKTGAWEMVDCIKINDRFNGNAVDPDVTRLPDGRYRLVYFEGNFVSQNLQPGDPNPIYSAISDDGIHFSVENLLIAEQGVTDPSLIQLPDGSWLLAMVRGTETLLAASEDGASFSLTGVTVKEVGIPELGLLPDGRVVLYLSKIFVSTDKGQTWQPVKDAVVPGNGADPSLLAMPAGGYAFSFKRIFLETH
ncbi:MAG TPA: exo-alpha-sialidase [Caldithrix abyssi]|uniref:Exo-alpha-sialidase n=1 Tax=Caldithrix abyssi TaxID=187145 RepID=A0A7V5PNQ0_CALAY|nr:exo-alpha-sialidase [Caldithrix abyssi]